MSKQGLTEAEAKKTLAAAQRIYDKAKQVNARQIRRRIQRITGILLIGLFAAVVSVCVIWFDWAQTPAARDLTAFLLLLGLALAVVSMIALVMVLWTGMLYEHVKTLEAAGPPDFVLEVAEKGIEVVCDPAFTAKVGEVVAEEIASALGIRKDEAVAAAAQGAVVAALQDRLVALYCDSLAVKTADPELVEDLKQKAMMHGAGGT